MNRQIAEQIIHDAEKELGKSKTIEDMCREKEISSTMYHRSKEKYGDISLSKIAGNFDE